MAVGSIFYGWNKIEGDMLLWRRDLGGTAENQFYDRTDPAIYFTAGGRELMIPLPDLPRYNDYLPQDFAPQSFNPNDDWTIGGDLNIHLHEHPQFRDFFETLGVNLRATIPGFISYGMLEPNWIESAPPVQQTHNNLDDGQAPNTVDEQQDASWEANPALRLGFGDIETPAQGFERVLLARWPAGRVIDEPQFALEYLDQPTLTRVKDLTSQFEGPHGLVVEIPPPASPGSSPGSSPENASENPSESVDSTDASKTTEAIDTGFKKVYSIEPGTEMTLGNTGYRLKVEAIGPYGMSFASRGYQGARDTRAVVAVYHHDELLFRRIVMHRYPKRCQDFTPAPDDPTVGPMGRRSDPDPRLRLAYIDATKPQYRVISTAKDTASLYILARLPGRSPVIAPLKGHVIPVSDGSDQVMGVHILERLRGAIPTENPRIIPKRQRDPKKEGTYLHALLPVDLEIDLPMGSQNPPQTWRQRIWLTHMRYPDEPQTGFSPVQVPLPFASQAAIAQRKGSEKMPEEATFRRTSGASVDRF